MTWQLVHSVTVNALNNSIQIPYPFIDTILVVEAICTNAKPTWFSAGYLYPIIDIPNVGNTRGIYRKVNLTKQIIRFDQVLAADFYTLEFVANNWIPNITLNFWEHTMPLYPISSDLLINPTQSSAVTSKTVAVTTTVTKLLDINTTRKAFSIYNPDSSKTVYVDVVNTVSTTVASFIIPPGQAYVSDFSWGGEVYAIIKTGTITVVIREFT